MIYTNFTRPDGPRRNLFTYTNEVGDSRGWNFFRLARTPNAITSPSGAMDGVLFTDNTALASYVFTPNFTFEAGKTYTVSVYAKYYLDALLIVNIPSTNGFSGSSNTFNLQTGVMTGNQTTGSITSVGDGWYRCSHTATCLTTTTANWICFQSSPDVIGAGWYLWGAQVEVGGLTEYQPVVSGLEFSVEPLNHARIGWENLAYGLTPTSSTAAAGFPAIAATYPTTFEFWKPTALPAAWGIDFGSAKTVDYCGLVGDLNGATIEIQSSSNFSTWTTRGTIGPTTDRINMALFLPVEARYWRLLVTVAIPSIAVVYLGQALAMQRKIYQGHTPLTLSRMTELSNNMSDGGQYLGRSVIRKGAQTSCDWSHLTADWYRANFDPFVKAARTAPFFIGWRPESYPNELGYVWTDNDIAPQNTGPKNYMSVGVSFMGLINE
jgi:hypothetical protein